MELQQRRWFTRSMLASQLIGALLLSLAVGESAWAQQKPGTSEARQKLLEALKGKVKPPAVPAPIVVPQQPVPSSQGNVQLVGKLIQCKRIDTGWKPKLPLDFPGIGKMFLGDQMIFTAIGCRSCHSRQGLGFPMEACDSHTIHRDGRWATGGREHTRHQKAGVICLECHVARAR